MRGVSAVGVTVDIKHSRKKVSRGLVHESRAKIRTCMQIKSGRSEV